MKLCFLILVAAALWWGEVGEQGLISEEISDATV